MLIRPAIGDTDPIRYRRPTPEGSGRMEARAAVDGIVVAPSGQIAQDFAKFITEVAAQGGFRWSATRAEIFSFQALLERASGEPARSVRFQRKKTPL